MTDHGKCTTCGRDMHPASRYGGLCWECHDADGERKDAEIRVLRAAVVYFVQEGDIEATKKSLEYFIHDMVDDAVITTAEADIIRRIIK